jgi:hypothetical protein
MIYRLNTRQKSGRPSEISEEVVYQIKKELKESSYGWTTKQAEELIVKKSGIKYHYTHIYRILRKWGFKQKMPRKVHVNTAPPEEKEAFKRLQKLLVDKHIQEQQQKEEEQEKQIAGFTIVSLDESFFFYESCKTGLDCTR